MSIVEFPRDPEDLPNGLLLGWQAAKEGRMTPVWDTGREGHLLTVAPTGAGKGVSCIIPALLTWHGPAVVIDPRGENYAVTAARRRALGQRVHVLDPFGVTGAKSDSLNPLDLLDYGSADFEDNAAAIATMLIQGKGSLDDPFWDERATALIISLIHTLYAQNPSNPPTLSEVRNDLHQPARLDLKVQRAATQLILEQTPSRKAANMRNPAPLSFNQFGTDRTRASIFATASSHLGFLRSSAVEDVLSDSTVSLSSITLGAPMTVYLVIPPDKLVSHGKLLRLWIGVMLAAISRRRRPALQPTLFLVDEAAQLGELDEIRSMVTLMRGYGVRLWTFWQDLSQLKRIYERDWESIVNNSTTLQLFGTVTRRTLDAFDIEAATIPSHAKRQLLLRRQGDATILIRPDYRNDRAFMGMTTPNPFYEQPATAEVIPFVRDAGAKLVGRE